LFEAVFAAGFCLKDCIKNRPPLYAFGNSLTSISKHLYSD